MNYWEILGIAATNDTAVIKKAYAARLKVTRPDDAAEAYQQLRDAYQQALKHSTSAAPALAQEAAAPAPAEASTEIRPEQFIGIVFKRWNVEEQSSLMAFWPELKAMLDRVPLDQVNAFSNIAAALILEYPKLPVDFVEQLSIYFEWKRDFALARSLGSSQSADLLARLDRLPFELEALRLKKEYEQEALIKAANQAKEAEHQRVQNIRQEFARASDFAQLLKMGDARRYAILAGPGLRQEWSKLSEEHQDVLHLDAETREQGKAILSQAARARTTVTALIAAAAAIASVISGTSKSYALPFLLLLLASYLLPLGSWHEKARAHLYPAGIMRRLLTDGVRDARFARAVSVMMCFYAVIICAAVHHLQVGDVYPPVTLVAIAFLLFISWATPQEENHPDLEITPAIFGLCVISTWTLGAKSAMIVSVAALWHALSYASFKKTWLYACILLWALIGVFLYFYYGHVPLAVIGVGVPWLLFTLYRKESPGYALAALAISIICLPFANAATQMIWTGAVTLTWMAAGAAMRWWSKRILLQQSIAGLSCGN